MEPDAARARALRDSIVNTTEWLGSGKAINTGTRLHAPHSNAVGAGKIDAQAAVKGKETTIITPRAGILAVGVGATVAYLSGESAEK